MNQNKLSFIKSSIQSVSIVDILTRGWMHDYVGVNPTLYLIIMLITYNIHKDETLSKFTANITSLSTDEMDHLNKWLLSNYHKDGDNYQLY